MSSRHYIPAPFRRFGLVGRLARCSRQARRCRWSAACHLQCPTEKARARSLRSSPLMFGKRKISIMKLRSIFVLAAFALVVTGEGAAPASRPDEDAIKAARARQNEAIAEFRIDDVVTYWT